MSIKLSRAILQPLDSIVNQIVGQSYSSMNKSHQHELEKHVRDTLYADLRPVGAAPSDDESQNNKVCDELSEIVNFMVKDDYTFFKEYMTGVLQDFKNEQLAKTETVDQKVIHQPVYAPPIVDYTPKKEKEAVQLGS